MQIDEKIDINLYHLWYVITDFQENEFSKEIHNKLRELINIIEKDLFIDVPNDYEIENEICTLTLNCKKIKRTGKNGSI